MRILVAGAAGAVGNKVVQELVDKGHDVIGLVHSEDKKSGVKEAGGEPVLADVTDKSTLDEPVSKADVVIFAAGSGGKAVEEVDRDGAINLVQVAQEKGVDRFIMLSSMAAGEPDRGPDELQDYLVAKGKADDALRSSGLRYTIVMPGSLTDGEGTGNIRAGRQGQLDSGEIARTDVARALAACALEDLAGNKSVEIVAGDQSIRDALAGIAE